MDKTAIRNFAIEARKILMKSAITEAGFYGITKDGCKDPVQKGNDFEVYETVAGTENRIFGDDIKRRANLVQAIKTLGFEQVIEETAYTWFNRIIAIRFMEVNNYLPTRVRVLSSETGSGTPDIITQADTAELNLTSDELEKIQTAKRENRYDDAFRMLFIKQCNELNAILPGLFEKTDDYMELLLKITYTGDGVIRMLVDSIPEDNFNVETEGQVEIIGWMYQYYNTELKDDTFAKLKKNVKITKERIPAATQLFTPDWIVRYMVENSLGRVWIEHLRAVNPSVDEKAKAEEFGWKYYLPEAEQEDDVQTQLVEIRKTYKDLTPQDITCIDPCMGSGHILVYMFDVLMDIYRSEGFSEREAVFDILEKNIRGLDIDRRAYQLSYFALMMKARGYNRIFFRGHEDLEGNRVQAVPQVYAIEESNSIDREQLKYFGSGMDALSKNNAINQINGLLDTLCDAKEYGSILSIDNYDWKLLNTFLSSIEDEGQGSLFGYIAYQSQGLLQRLVNIGSLLAQEYSAVITNPPYMGNSGMNEKLVDYLKDNYPDSRTDMFSVFIEKCISMLKNNGVTSMITQPSWLFLTSFEKMRRGIVSDDTILSMLHMGRGIFGVDFGSVAFTIKKGIGSSYKGNYFRLHKKNFQYINPADIESIFISTLKDYDFRFDFSKYQNDGKEKAIYLESNLEGQKIYYVARQVDYEIINSCPIAYWCPEELFERFKKSLVGELFDVKSGLSTGDNETFVKNWYELSMDSFTPFNNQGEWVPYNKGGGFRKWYGVITTAEKWGKDGEYVRENGKAVFRNPTYYFREGLTWTGITSGIVTFRYCPKGYLFDSNKGPMIFEKEEDQFILLGFLNSNVANMIIKMLNPTVSVQIGDVVSVPLIDLSEEEKKEVKDLVLENIKLSKQDWDDKEISWNYQGNILLNNKKNTLKETWEYCTGIINERFETLKKNEERLNEIFISKYGLGDVLSKEVDDDDITVIKADERQMAVDFISYAVGCMMGRYSLKESGLILAGGLLDKERYDVFLPDEDGIIPIGEEAYLNDDVVKRLVDFISITFGENQLSENVDFLASKLGRKENASSDILRNYMLNEFYTEHCNLYSPISGGKKPIYWLVDSGKQNGFKCLVYMHRYTKNTMGIVRSDYLVKTQAAIENALKNEEYTISNTQSAVDRASSTRKRDKYIKQLSEIRVFYQALSHIALQGIELNLDDGVKINYEKFQNIEVSVEGEKKQKINLLAKI